MVPLLSKKDIDCRINNEEIPVKNDEFFAAEMMEINQV